MVMGYKDDDDCDEERRMKIHTFSVRVFLFHGK